MEVTLQCPGSCWSWSRQIPCSLRIFLHYSFSIFALGKYGLAVGSRLRKCSGRSACCCLCTIWLVGLHSLWEKKWNTWFWAWLPVHSAFVNNSTLGLQLCFLYVVAHVTVAQTKHIPGFMKSFVCLFPQLAGTGVLAVGLWLRFDERTKGLFTGEDPPSVFLTGEFGLDFWVTLPQSSTSQ